MCILYFIFKNEKLSMYAISGLTKMFYIRFKLFKTYLIDVFNMFQIYLKIKARMKH